MEIASDQDGRIWVTTFSNSLLLRFDPRADTFTRYAASFGGNNAGGLYGLLVTPTGDIWVTLLAVNALAHLEVAANRFVFYRLPPDGSSPLGLVMSGDQTLWFTEMDKIGMLRPEEPAHRGT